MAIRFYKEKGELGYLASYSPHGFFYDGVYWKTVEHYYQAHKFEDMSIRAKIIEAKTPKEASVIGRDRNNPLLPNWNNKKISIMKEAVYLKFKAHKDIAKKLLETGDEEIIEATVKEDYWGCGPLGNGQNHYGIILCEVRSILRKEFESV